MNEESLFHDAREKLPEERSAFLDEACAGNVALRERVEVLLRADENPASFLHSPPSSPWGGATAEHPPIAEGPGTVIGPYKLLQQIGEGGMGVVFMAEQSQPIQRTVALKIIKPGMDTRQVIARFEAERQALAMMDHPNIAKVLDAGATENGRPYFVMELVQGVPITEYCDECNLTTRERLKLFIAVCQAVQHAHQKGVIHRDIKPSNVLIAIQDGQPAPKVIDFGVAKALNQRLTERTLATGFAQMIGTPLYMSPEQAELSPLDADTRSDIYSLGVLLYELLTGTTPFDKDRLHAAGFDELRRILREDEPPRPSSRISTLAADLATTVTAHRGSDSRRLVQTIRGDLDWIVMKCLEKDRGHRYDTASDLAQDIERFLNGEPVEACPPSAMYRFRKFAHRSRAALATAAALLFTVVASLTVSTVLIAQQRDAAQAAAAAERQAAERAETERLRAEENLRQARAAVDQVFTKVAHDLEDKPHLEQIRRELLEDALKFYQGFLEQKRDDPQIRFETAMAYYRISPIYEELGHRAECVDAARHSVAIMEALAREHPDSVIFRNQLAHSYHQLGCGLPSTQSEEAVELLTKALALLEQLAHDSPSVPNYRWNVATKHVDLARALGSAGKINEQETYLRRSIAHWEQFRNDFPSLPRRTRFEETYSLDALSVILWKQQRFEEADRYLRQSLEISTRLLEQYPQDPQVHNTLGFQSTLLGEMMLDRGRLPEAEEKLRSAIESLQPIVNDFPSVIQYHHRLRRAHALLSTTLFAQRRFSESEEEMRKALLVAAADPADDESEATHLRYQLGLLVHHRGRIQEAADLFREAFVGFERLLDDDPDHVQVRNVLRWALVNCPLLQFRDPERALGFSNELLQRDVLSADGWSTAGIAHYRLHHWDEAIVALRGAEERKVDEGRGSLISFFLAMAYQQRGEPEKARRAYERALTRIIHEGRNKSASACV